jgi:SAM-dependent methyltransferase
VFGGWEPGGLSLPARVCTKGEIDRPPGRYLELGVGQGQLYQWFVKRGWTCCGIDPGDWSSRFPNVVRHLDDAPGDFNADVVAALDVLEHVTDPIAILRSLRQRTSPNGHIYCAMPNRESVRAKRHGTHWRMVRPIGHVNYYSRKSITLALEKTGFRVRRLRATDLCEIGFPRRLADIRPAWIEWTGGGDQWVVVAAAC